VSEQLFNLRNFNDVNVPIFVGTVPPKGLEDRAKITNDEGSVDGTPPYKLLLSSDNEVSPGKLLINAGIDPFILLKLICKSIRLLDALK
jgi:hypothetical protein